MKFYPHRLFTFQEALPRTAAAIAVPYYGILGLFACMELSQLFATFAMDSPNAKQSTANAIVFGGAFTGATAGAAVGYGLGYGGSNILMAAFPKTRDIKTRFLLGPGITPILSMMLVSSLFSMAFGGGLDTLNSMFNTHRSYSKP